MSSELMVMPRQQGIVTAEDLMPVLDMEMAINRHNFMVEVTRQLMVQDTDYGVIPGTQKPTLLKPGAEKLCTLYGLSPEYILEHSIEDWTGADHSGESFFYYRFKCRLTKNGILLGEGVGSCNSWESKYRYREGKRLCPACGKDAIIKGRADYGGGWLCFAKKGGCGAKYKDGDKSIEGQDVGRVPNPDIADQVNTIQKMGQKRALIAGVLVATNASEFYTQDIEDMQVIDVRAEPAETQEQVRDRRIAEERAKLEAERSARPTPQSSAAAASSNPTAQTSTDATQHAEAVPANVQEMWRRMGSKVKPICDEFASLKKAMVLAVGPSGESEYHRILTKHGMEHSNDVVKGVRVQTARMAAWDCVRFLESVKELNQEAAADPHKISDADLPATLWPKGDAPAEAFRSEAYPD